MTRLAVCLLTLLSTLAPPAVAAPGAKLEVDHAPSHFQPGMIAAYLTIKARASGPVTVVDEAPPGLTPTAAGGAGWTCSITGTRTTCKHRKISYDALPVLRIVVNVSSTVPPQVRNTAVLTTGRRTVSDTDLIPTRDSCPFGWRVGQSIFDSGVPNPTRPDGCTLLDAIWADEPFGSHRAFVVAVRDATDDFVRDGLLTRRQQRAVLEAAARSDVGRQGGEVDNTCDKRIALKFDDGPSSYRPALLRLLRAKRVHATFFDNGVRVDANPQINRFQVAEGHVQLNHTYLHVHMDQLPEAAIRDEVLRTERALRRAGAPQTFRGIRPPFGGTSELVQRVLLEMGYTEFRSALQAGAEDWLPDKSATAIANDILAQLRPGLIIGLHDGPIDTPAGAATVQAVGMIIDQARARGYCFGVPDDTAHVVADRYAPSDRPVPGVVDPVPYRIPLVFGATEQLPQPWVRIPSPLRLTATHTPASFTRGGTGTLSLTVTNTGRRQTDGSTVRVAATVPTGLTGLGAAGNGWTCTGTTCTRTDVLSAGRAYPPITIPVTVAPDAPPSVTATAALTAHAETWTDETTDPIEVR